MLNCYVKKDKKAEISQFLTIKSATEQPIFDVDTAIEVCRQQDSTRMHAIKLAEQKQRWKLLVQIYIESQNQYKKALVMIDTRINNVREKVDLLQMYGPKLLKECEHQQRNATVSSQISMIEKGRADDRSITMEDVSDVAFRIVEAMVYYTAHGNAFARQQDRHLELLPKQVVRIEDLLQIFVDHHDLMTDFLKRILTEFSDARF